MTWQTHAACKDSHPDLFFPVRNGGNHQYHKAVAICRTCPVQRECLNFAIDNNEEYGIWGGMNLHERDAVARRRRSLRAVS
jgi:WhiB family redox-sensing transcriptional regulator